MSALAREFQYLSFAICLSVSIDNCKSNSREICQYQDFCPSHSKNPSRLAGLLNIQLVHKSCELSHYWRETMWYMGSGVRQGLDPHDIAWSCKLLFFANFLKQLQRQRSEKGMCIISHWSCLGCKFSLPVWPSLSLLAFPNTRNKLQQSCKLFSVYGKHK